MKINALITSYSNKKPALSCKGSLKISPLKNIEGNICACCGNKMISYTEVSEMWANITRPISEMIKHKNFNIIKENYPQIFQTLLDFAGAFPDQSIDRILLDDINHSVFMDSVEDSFSNDKEYCYSSAINRIKAMKTRTMTVLKFSENTLKNSAEVTEYLQNLKEYFHGYRIDILNDLYAHSKKYPTKTLSEIIKIPEIAERYIEGTYVNVTKLAKIRDLHWEKAENLILSKKPKLEKEIKKIRTQICKLYRTEYDRQRLLYKIQELYKNLIDEYNLKEIAQDVHAELSCLPTLWYDKNSFLSYARRYYNDGAIVNYLIKPYMESEEHIIPISDGGYNQLNNKITICRSCNMDRGTYPYEEFLKYHPEMIQNTEKQINLIAQKVIDGSLTSDLKDYPFKVSKTLADYTQGLINPDLSWYIESLHNKNLSSGHSH